MWIQWENMKELLRSIFAINYKKKMDTLDFKEYVDPFTGSRKK